MFNWARSFTLWVWTAIITTYLVSAFVYRFIHLYGAGEHFERETKLRKRVVLFDSFMTFNGHNQYIPRSIAGKQFHVPCKGRLILQLTVVLFIQGKSLLSLSISSVW